MKTQRLSLDGITTLPQNIIETILCLLPIQEAARTSILSKEWRYTWTKIPKVVFNQNTFEISTDMNQPSILEQTSDSPDQGQWMIMRFNLLYAINQVLLLRQGPILEFTLFMYADDTCLEIDQIILHLLRNNTIRKLSLLFGQFNSPDHGEYMLPLSIFSLHQLTHLYLRWCYLDHQPTFNGFGSLTTLSLKNVYISSKSLLHLLSNCPLLKTVNLFLHEGNILGDDNFTFTELFGCLPVLEKFSMWHWLIECFAQDGVPQVLPITLIHLKHFIIKDFYFTDEYGLRLLGLVMRSSPNLENLTLMMYEYPSYEETKPDLVKDYSHIWLEHLNECKIGYFANFKHEMEFVKLILAKAPVLKKVSIRLHDDVTEDEELTISRILSNSPRASSVAEVLVQR